MPWVGGVALGGTSTESSWLESARTGRTEVEAPSGALPSLEGGRSVGRVDDMVFTFANEDLRNAAGRAVREAGYSCFGSQTPAGGDGPCLLTVQELDRGRRDAAEQLVHQKVPAVRRLS